MKKTRMAFFLCAALFVAALLLTAVYSHYDSAGGGRDVGKISGSVVLSEILPSNRTYPDKDGRLLDYVELRNLTGNPIDISGYKLSDDGVSIGYTFPADTILPADGYIVCWCDKGGSGGCADFGISRKGGDTIVLFNSVNVVIDRKEVPRMDANVPLVRRDDGLWGTFSVATPGYENTQAGYEAWLHAMGGDDTRIVISEVQSANSCTVIGQGEACTDWVELFNAGEETVTLHGAYLSDDPIDRAKFLIPDLFLAPGQRAVIPCVGRGAGDGEAGFALTREGCTVVLTGPLGNILSQVECPALAYDHAWALQTDGTWADATQATPGFENTPEGISQYLRSLGAEALNVMISEIQTHNRSTVINAAGEFCDWVELWNAGDSEADLTGAYLSDDPEDRARWRIPALRLAPDERAVIMCSGPDAGSGEADFALSSKGCTLTLTGSAGNVLSQVECPGLGEDRVWALQEDGSFQESDTPTPGFENTESGASAWLETQLPAGDLVICEVMPSNNRYLRQSDGRYYDWLELYNASDAPVELSDYALSDDPEQPLLFPLPAQTVRPGERVIVVCSGNTSLTRYIQAPFTISREEDVIYLTGPDGRLSDHIRVHSVPVGGSVGRAHDTGSVVYFDTPTPSMGNGEGAAAVSGVPEVLTAPGVYNGVDSVSVEFSALGEIRYTLDGSEPTADSELYSGPLTLEHTTVIRAASFEPGKLRSGVLTASYVINENHTLPVLSLAGDPGDIRYILGRSLGDYEIPCSLEMFEEGGGFAIDCGVELFGFGQMKYPKKNIKVNFRGAYGAKVLSYPVFGEDGPQIYEALCIRAGQNYGRSIFKDNLFVSLCRQLGDNALTQREKFCILYINGEYYGVYCLKEAFNETYYAENKRVSRESVTILQAPVGGNTEVYSLMRFCNSHDMSVQENYDYIASRLDIASFIDWTIVQGYSTNWDIVQNTRYFKSTENGDKWQLAFYDLDYAFADPTPFFSLLSPGGRQYKVFLHGLFNNHEFREQFFDRLRYAMENVLSNENVLSVIDGYEELLAPEIPRERARWGGSYEAWTRDVQVLRDFFTKRDYLGEIVKVLRQTVGLTEQEEETYFGRWAP